MDLDTTSTKDSHFKILRKFGAGEADILIGTQMIAKGLDFPNVTLVGIVNADIRLLMPDFRAAEHTFHLLSQVAGRSGRREKAGEVILQTRNPRHDVIQRATLHDFHGFAEHELAERQALSYPPFGRMIAIEFRGPDESAAEQTAQKWTGELRPMMTESVVTLGPEAAFISRLKKNYRFQTILKLTSGSDPAAVKEAIKEVSEKVKGIGKTRVVVDVDPVGLL
jgi:primosomal protein N' (replication factor Y)